MKALLPFLLIAVMSACVNAQDVLPNKVYRVTAYQRGNNNIVSTSNYAEVIPPVSIFIPSAFTPNNDGYNDDFGVKGEGIENYKMLIYNRWGQVIFSSTNPMEHWDGNYNNEPAENGVYVYEVFAKGFGKHPKTGSVTLLR
jgi:gliding motility-associated-like protein